MARILVVDDERSIRLTLGEFLRAAGYDVAEAEDAEQAIGLLNAGDIDVVVADIILPRVTGVELLQRIRQAAPHVQVVMMTGEPTVETASESLRAGAFDYLFKPITKDAILRVVAKAAQLKAADDERRRLEAENQRYQRELERLVEERTQALRESEERYRLLVETSPYAIGIHQDGRLVFVNAAGARLLGAPTVEALLGRPIDQMVHPDRWPDSRARIDRMLRGETGLYPTEDLYVRLDGSTVPVEVTATPFTHRGRPAVQVIALDITARKQAEEQVRRLSRLYAALSQTNQAIVREADPEALLQKVCDIAVEHGGLLIAWVGWAEWQAKQVIPKGRAGPGREALQHVFVSLDPADPRSRGPTGQALLTNRPSVCNDCLADPNLEPWREVIERYGCLSAASFPIQQGGKAVAALTVYARDRDYFDTAMIGLLEEMAEDISFALDRFELERQRQEAEWHLRESESRFRHLLTSLNDVVWSSSLDGSHMHYVNHAVERVYGRSVEEFMSNPRLWLEVVHPEDRRRVEELSAALHRLDHVESEYRIVRPDGTVRWILDRKGVVRDEEGRPERLGGIATDITERKAAEEALHLLSGQLLRLQDEERRRIARELHDTTSQNLAALSMNLSLLQQALDEASPRVQRLLQDCVALAQTSTQEIRTISYLLHPPMLDVLGLPGALREFVGGFAKRSGIQVTLDVPEGFGRLEADIETALFRVVQESLGNIHRHSGSRTARVCLRREPDRLTLEVSDTGRGIPPEKLAAIERGAGGLGVGITGMRERLHQLGGRLDITSGSGGTCVRAVVPIAEPKAGNRNA